MSTTDPRVIPETRQVLNCLLNNPAAKPLLTDA